MSCSKCKTCSCSKNTPKLNISDKWRYTLYTTVIFILVVNPYAYQLTNKLFSVILGKIAINGCPTMIGLLLHVVIFTLILRYIMELDL